MEINRNIKVLMYHRVLFENPEKNSNWHYVKVSEFENQMKWLDRLGYTSITFADYALYLKGDLSLPKKPIIITFDDGYLDTFENAIPIMLKYNMRGVIFVMGNRAMRRADWEQPEKDVCPLMNDDQVRIAEALGFEIGAHSMNHSDLKTLSEEELDHEILWSKFQIEQVLGKPILSFAYPYGGVNERAQLAAIDSGFKFACGVYTGPAWFGANQYDIRRIAINEEMGTFSFLLRILTPFEYLEWSYAKLKDNTVTVEQREQLSGEKQEEIASQREPIKQKTKVVLN